MSTTDFIDPVTGAPIVTSDNIFQQIPLGQSIVPFADLDATDRPARLPLYPDDVIPTSSVTVGMQDKTPRAITATAILDTASGKEKNRALDVNIAGNAGGSGLSAVKGASAWGAGTGADFWADQLFAIPLPMLSGILGVSMSGTAEVGTWAYGGYNIELLLGNADHSQLFGLCVCALLPCATPTGKTAMVGGSNNISFAVPVDPSSVITSPTATIWIHSQTHYGIVQLFVSFTVVYA